MEDKKTTGLDRQMSFLEKHVNEGFDYGIVVAKAFLDGMRKIGYKNTAYALFESIDNSIQAEANSIHILFDWDTKGKGKTKEPDRIAILDNGHGMDPRMIRIAALWGGSDRVNNREGLGRFGYGLPSSSISIGQKFTIYSKLAANDQWWFVPMDIEEIGNNNPFYFNKETGRVEAPQPQAGELPEFVKKYLTENKLEYASGSVVLIDKIDTLTHKNFGNLKEFLLTETGVCYRNYLGNIKIEIDGTPVEPVDPLFITEGAKYYDEDYERAEAVPSMEIPIKDVGIIKARFSYMSPTFLRFPDEKLKMKGKNNKRFDIRKDNNGVIVLRAGRQIDVVTTKSPFTFQNNDRYIGIELDFPPSMDEFFSVTTSKQQIVVNQRIWDILRDAGFDAAVSDLKSRYSGESKEVTKKIKLLKGLTPEEKVQYVEGVMAETAKELETEEETKPKHIKENAEKERQAEVEKRVAEELPTSGIPEPELRKKIQAEVEREENERPHKLEFMNEEDGPFFRPKRSGGQVTIYINKAHKFYTDFYENADTSQFVRNALVLLLFSIGLEETKAIEEKRKWYTHERREWSKNLEIALDKLLSNSVANSKHSSAEDDEVFDEEIEAMKSKS